MTARLSIVPADAFSDPRLTPADVRVLGVLGSFLDRKNECFPSQMLVAQRANLNRGTVNRSLRKLVEFGYVNARQRWPGKAKSVLVYHVFLDEQMRSEAGQEQPELFPVSPFERSQNPAKSDVAKNDMQEAEIQQIRMLEKATSAKSDVTSRGHIDVTSGRHTELPKVTPHSSVSNETGLSAEDDDESDIVSQPSSGELKRSMVFTTGKLLLIGQGISKRDAGSFLGKLVKDFGIDAVVSAITAAADQTPVDGLTWLRKAAEGEARKRGRKVPEPKNQASTGLTLAEWTDAVGRWWRGKGIWPKRLGERPDEIGYHGPLEPIEALLANGRIGDPRIVRLKRNLDDLRAIRAHHATDRKIP